MKNLISEQNYQKALERGRSAMSREPYATHARFNSGAHLLSVEFSACCLSRETSVTDRLWRRA